ncbi:MAG TPA: hypothetical protein VFB06_28840 [Streptosporangiaceae bacterium]|nr:hypothetical protein [Streptosporangiaceae bacterium]
MSFKTKFFAAAGTLALAGATAATGAMTANAATPPCGKTCIDLYSRLFGSHKHPQFVFSAKGGSQNTGTPIILWRASNSDRSEDFTVSAQGQVKDFFAAGLVSAALNLHYHNLEAFEFEYSPFGADSGMCIGTATTAFNGTKVSLQPCGVSSKTIWVVDSFSAIKGFYVPLINGSDTNFSHPYVLNYPSGGFPTDNPRPQLQTWNLLKFSNGTTVDNEMFSANFGVLF